MGCGTGLSCIHSALLELERGVPTSANPQVSQSLFDEEGAAKGCYRPEHRSGLAIRAADVGPMWGPEPCLLGS